MIILSGVLVVVAIGLLVAGIVAGNGEGAQVLGLEALTVIYISIAVSIVSALCLAVGVFLRRRELFGARSATSARPKKAKRGKKADRAVPAKGKEGRPAPQEPAKSTTTATVPGDDMPTVPAHPAGVPDDALVYVIRGRKRYHLETCRQLAGRDKEDLTYVEAKEEGFSPCTACMPDTALAARAAASATTAAAGSAKTSDKAKPTGKPGSTSPTAGKPTPTPAKPSLGKPAAPPASPAPAPAESKPPAPSARLGAPAVPTVTDQPMPAPVPPATAKPAPKAAEPPTLDRPAASPAPSPAKDQANGSQPAAPAVVQSAAAPPSTPAQSRPPAGADSARQPAATGDSLQVRILSGTKRYHRADCALIEDIGDEADDLEALSRAEAKARGCTPCLVCQPDKEHARD